MVLVGVVGARREDQLRLALRAEFLDGGLGLLPVRGQAAVRQFVHGQPQVGARAEGGERGLFLLLALAAAAGEHQRVDADAGPRLAQRQQGAAGADGDVVAVGAHDDDPVERTGSEPDHARTPALSRSHTAHGRSPRA